MPRPNPIRLDGSILYRLDVDASALAALPLARALRELVGDPDRSIPACPRCASARATVHRLLGDRVSTDELACGRCGSRWPATRSQRRGVAKFWRERARLVTVAVRFALPRAIRDREVLAPTGDDVNGWARVGIADALLGRPPVHFPTIDAPAFAHAYAWGWTQTIAILNGHDMTTADDAPVSTPLEAPGPGLPPLLPPKLAAAFIAAVCEAQQLQRDGSHTSHGAYSTADSILAEMRRILSPEGLHLARLGHELSEKRSLLEVMPDDPVSVFRQGDPSLAGNMYYVGEVRFRWILFHSSGEYMLSDQWGTASPIPVIAQRGRPHDKSVEAAITYAWGKFVQGFLGLDREDKNTAVERRNDEQRERQQQQRGQQQQRERQQQQRERQQQQRGQESERRVVVDEDAQPDPERERPDPPADPFVAKGSELEAEIRALVDELTDPDSETTAQVFEDVLESAGLGERHGDHPGFFGKNNGHLYKLDRPSHLRESEAAVALKVMREWKAVKDDGPPITGDPTIHQGDADPDQPPEPVVEPEPVDEFAAELEAVANGAAGDDRSVE